VDTEHGVICAFLRSTTNAVVAVTKDFDPNLVIFLKIDIITKPINPPFPYHFQSLLFQKAIYRLTISRITSQFFHPLYKQQLPSNIFSNVNAS